MDIHEYVEGQAFALLKLSFDTLLSALFVSDDPRLEELCRTFPREYAEYKAFSKPPAEWLEEVIDCKK